VNQQDKEVEALQQRLARLEQQHQATAEELREIQAQLRRLTPTAEVVEEARVKPVARASSATSTKQPPGIGPSKPGFPKIHWESFIGENLINKIGIIITIIGIAVGIKYSIDNNLLGPVARVLVGYGLASVLLAIGFKLKKKYMQYSAVLVSGAMTIYYLITYAAYSLYELFPQELTFLLMVLFTLATVLLALRYNQQVIAHLGLVGAYAVPFLLSTGSGKVYVLLTYLAILNTGILVLAFKKYWKPLLNLSFALTWLIVGGWLLIGFHAEEHFSLAAGFLPVFFLLFYAGFLAYKGLHKLVFSGGDVFLLMSNAFLFFGLGTYLLHEADLGAYLGMFTLLNGILHAGVGFVLYRVRLFDKRMLLFLFGLSITFVSIAIPVSLDASWVTLLWAFEAALLFYIGRSQGEKGYERLAYPLVILTLFSLVQDWGQAYYFAFSAEAYSGLHPFQNIFFYSGLLVSAALASMVYGFFKWPKSPLSGTLWTDLMRLLIPLAFLGVLYFTFFLEIKAHWEGISTQLSTDRSLSMYYAQFNALQQLWLIHYSLAYFTVFTAVLIKFGKRFSLTTFAIWLNLFVLAVCAYLAFPALADFTVLHKEVFPSPMNFFLLRYVFLALFGCLVGLTFAAVKRLAFSKGFRVFVHLSMQVFILLALSSELVHWLEMWGNQQAFKLALSILWGVYALWLIVLGIWQRKGYLRIGAMVLLGATLLKLFVYDLSSFNTLSKTVVFVSLGLLLLVVSFLYNKYRAVIFTEDVPASDQDTLQPDGE
jgi:uncharacterized membrane protein